MVSVRSSNKDGSQDEGECGLRTSFKVDYLNRWSAPSATEEVDGRRLITTGVSNPGLDLTDSVRPNSSRPMIDRLGLRHAVKPCAFGAPQRGYGT